MRCPDTAAGGHSCSRQPGKLGTAAGGAGAVKQVDRSDTGQEADQHCKLDEPPIVLDREAVKYPEHGVLAR